MISKDVMIPSDELTNDQRGDCMTTRPYPSFLVYIDTGNQFRWRLQATNHRTIADSAESYHNYADCISAIGLIKTPHPVWQTQDVTNRVK